jgi:hypothetical protein
MARHSAALGLQGYTDPPHEVRGEPAPFRIAEVVSASVTYNDDGSAAWDHSSGIDIRPQLGRATKVNVPYPQWYTPQEGDLVLYTDLHGDPLTPIVVVPLTGIVRVSDGATGTVGGG